MKKVSIRERRLTALYNYCNNSNSTTQRELLTFLLATASHKIIKEAVEQFDIKID